MGTGKRLTNQDKLDIINYYQSEIMTVHDCAQYFNLCDPTIIKVLDEYNISRYRKSNIFNPNFNERFFEIIDSEAKAYYLGMIISDGNVFVPINGRQAQISISQSEEDIEILETFLYILGSNRRVGSDGRGGCCASVASNLMAEDLAAYGIIPRKTMSTYLPIFNDSDIMRHLIRGILDGDGCITAHESSRNKYHHSISFCGTHDLMLDIRDYISNELGVTRKPVYDYNNRYLSEVKWTRIEDCFEIGNWLYEDAEYYLPRKKLKFDLFCDHYGL